jgi:hypothetical protein
MTTTVSQPAHEQQRGAHTIGPEPFMSSCITSTLYFPRSFDIGFVFPGSMFPD